MHLIYIHQYFKTPDQGGAIRSYYMAKGLVDKGHQVDMITAHNGPYKLIQYQGIQVHYLPVSYYSQWGFYRRIWAFMKFSYLAYREALKVQNGDLCIATSTPLSVGWTAMKIKDKIGLPFIFEVRDLWPDAPIELGYIRSPWLIKQLQKWERSIYQQAHDIITLSPGIRKRVVERSDNHKVHFIPNMSDIDFFKFEPTNTSSSVRDKGSNVFTITYFGAVGKVNHLEHFIEIASLHSHLNIKFLIVGDGPKLAGIKRMAKQKELSNVNFMEPQNKDGLREVLRKTHATFISFAPFEILKTNSPNKFFDSLAAGKLIITNTEGWIKKLVEEHRCGFYCSKERFEDFGEKITPFIQDSKILATYQNNARQLAEKEFSRRAQVEKLHLLLEEIRINNSSGELAYTSIG